MTYHIAIMKILSERDNVKKYMGELSDRVVAATLTQGQDSMPEAGDDMFPTVVH